MTGSQYCPPPDSAAGWRTAAGDEEVRELGGMDPPILALLEREQQVLAADSSFGLVIIRHGYLVHECYSFNVSPTTRFDIWSATKSMTSTAWGVALADSDHRRPASGGTLSLDAPIYDLIPEGFPLTDPRKARVTIRHVLSMTSGIRGERASVHGCVTGPAGGPFEFALGRCSNRFGVSVAELWGEPGSTWDYSDPAFSHLSLAFATAYEQELAEYLDTRVLRRIGIVATSWEGQGGAGHIGPHSNAHTGFVISARELARFGYLFLHRGRWGDEQIVPASWVDQATRSSQNLNPSYGYGWVVNTAGSIWPYLPSDAFAANGFRSNRCYVVPSLDLVVARVGSGPMLWDEAFLMQRVLDAVLDA